MSEPAPTAPRRAVGAILGVGGVALVLAVFLTWGVRAEALFVPRETGSGRDVAPDGYVVLATGIVGLLAAGAWFAPLGRRKRRRSSAPDSATRLPAA
ncbi:MAG: hypothetical protein WD770_10610 [Actinomycetota bacterium]